MGGHPTEEVPAAVHLYAVFLGGDLQPGRMGEDHEVVFVVGDDVADVRRRARSKWGGVGRPHVDAVQRLHQIDGHVISVSPGAPAGGDVVDLDPTYVGDD
jgi:hypothetical protein